jgi:ribosomal protein S18 acetylase RimI-like enzyme
MTISVDKARRSELEETARLFARVLSEIPYYNSVAKEREGKKYTASDLATKLSEDPYAILVAKLPDGRIVGFCFSRLDDFTIWIDWYGVDPDSRQTGVGAAILKRTIETARERGAHKVWCDTRSTNEPSKNLLRKMGFTSLVEIKDHWYGQDFILWERPVRIEPPRPVAGLDP